jgi:hypothetical protein
MRVDAFEIVDDAPELTNVRAIAMLKPWIDVGKVGTLVLTSLERHMGAKELGRLARPGTFFDFTRNRPRTRIVDGQRVLTKPNSVVHFAHDEASDRDYMFLHLREPHMFGEDYTDAVMALLKHFNVVEYCRIGGMYDSVPHTRPLPVTATLTPAQKELAKDLVSVRANNYQGPTSIVNLQSEVLAGYGIESSGLMLHLPHYVQLDEDHTGAARLMEVLCAMYGFPAFYADTTRGERQYREISGAVENNPEVSRLIRRLEQEYDSARPGPESEEIAEDGEISMPAEMEQFLRDLENGSAERDE